MKRFIVKVSILLSIVFLTGFSTSCIRENYIDCGDAQIEVINNTNQYIYFSTNGSYCYASDFIEPYGSVTLSYGSLHTTADMPKYIYLDYRYGGPGYSVYQRDLEVNTCYHKEYLGD